MGETPNDAATEADGSNSDAASPDAAMAVPILLSELEVAGPGVYDDPMLTADGDIYFAGPQSDSASTQDLYTANWNPTMQAFDPATKVPGDVNTDEGESTLWISSDGLLILFGRRLSGSLPNVDIEFATRDSDTEDFVHQGPLPESSSELLLHSTATDALGALSSDRLSLFFVSNREGEFNLYEATRSDAFNDFDTVNKLTISNAALEESSIKLSSDELTLFYSIQETETDKNIYYATRASNNVAFSNPQPLSSINSPFFDDDFSPHPTRPQAVFSSNRNGGPDWRLFSIASAPR